jgi:L-alanine-DL-glutamate epimerase-like enolase superfamily enzyme
MMNANSLANIESLQAEVYRIPTDAPESDGTLSWDHTDLIVVHAIAAGQTGLGWTYASPAAQALVIDTLRPAVVNLSAFSIEGIWQDMGRRLRNIGRGGVGMMAISAVDTALWDLKARLLGVSLVHLLGSSRDEIAIYGSGGFTSYSEGQLAEQLRGWVAQGIRCVKMKVGRDARADIGRVASARKVIGDKIELFVDANGGYSRKQALKMAEVFSVDQAVSWFEEPRPSDDLEGLRLLRDRAPAGMDIAAGEYGDTPQYFRRMLNAGAVDCLQADVTRCGGYTGFLKVAALCEAMDMPLSAHCAPQLHAHVGCSAACLRHVEYFHDHVRIERMLFDGVLEPQGGALRPDPTRIGHGLAFKTKDAATYLLS